MSLANTEQADAAIHSCDRAFKLWRKTSIDYRIEKILELSKLIKKNRFELIAWMTEENGKNWGEADGEICELLDFNLAYACAMKELEKGIPYLSKHRGVAVECLYIPIGIGIAISPWNFPLALIGGMVTSALITGNTIVMKPSSDTPAVAYKLYQLIEEAGFPVGTVNFITGSGSKIGDFLVSHEKTRFINFTGSKNVGLRINELAARTSPDQLWIKKVVAEMGGKNAIIIDKSADIDKAVDGVINSAFTLQGQKCSACSRAIVHESILEAFTEKPIASVNALKKVSATLQLP